MHSQVSVPKQSSIPALSSDPLYLGLDLSTQQLKGLIIDAHQNIVFEHSIDFEKSLPQYHTRSGRHVQGTRVTVPVYMWVEAIDMLMAHISTMGYGNRICAISGAAQQHGSVYWTQQGIDKLGNLESNRSLVEQLQECRAFSVPNSPIWEDSSTSEQCRQIEDVAGGPMELARVTGSRAFERFTGPQIAKIKQSSPESWSNTARISLISSFTASLLAGDIAPVDVGDASGTNLFDIQGCCWSDELCESIDSSLVRKLGPRVCKTNQIVGRLSSYYAERYGINPNCSIVAFTGDNLSAFDAIQTLMQSNTAVNADSVAVVSLGTSDTVLFPLHKYPYTSQSNDQANECPEGHVLRHPARDSGYMSMLCYKNGSLAREWVRDRVAENKSWPEFDQLAGTGSLAPQAFGFYYLSMEIQPRVQGIYRFEQSPGGNILVPASGKRYAAVKTFSQGQTADARAIVESQLMGMLVDYRHKSPGQPLSAVVVTGGASENIVLRQAIADILGVQVYVINSSGLTAGAPAMPALGGAMRALLQATFGESVPARNGSAYSINRVCEPRLSVHRVYQSALADFEYLRQQIGP